MKTVRLSLKAARAIHLDYATRGDPPRALEELRAAIAHAERASTVRRKLAKPKAEKRKAKREATADVRAAVMRRAAGNCERCGRASVTQLDHFFGRARVESVETCWALCRGCHEDKTLNKPSAAWWLSRFRSHALTHGYDVAASKALNRLYFVEGRGEVGL